MMEQRYVKPTATHVAAELLELHREGVYPRELR